jgi:hypothetical protein
VGAGAAIGASEELRVKSEEFASALRFLQENPEKVWRYKRNSLSLHRQNIQGA